MVMMIMMNKNFNCFVFRAGRYLQASGRRVCLSVCLTPRLLAPTGASGGAQSWGRSDEPGGGLQSLQTHACLSRFQRVFHPQRPANVSFC